MTDYEPLISPTEKESFLPPVAPPVVVPEAQVLETTKTSHPLGAPRPAQQAAPLVAPVMRAVTKEEEEENAWLLKSLIFSAAFGIIITLVFLVWGAVWGISHATAVIETQKENTDALAAEFAEGKPDAERVTGFQWNPYHSTMVSLLEDEGVDPALSVTFRSTEEEGVSYVGFSDKKDPATLTAECSIVPGNLTCNAWTPLTAEETPNS